MLWRHVIGAIEAAAPLYDYVNEFISFGLASKARNCAAMQARLAPGMLILDVGAGPGNVAEAVVGKSSSCEVVGLDFSTRLLRVAKRKVPQIQCVRGVFESLPFRSLSFDRVFAGFSLRDARDLGLAYREVKRVLREDGCFLIIDVGKPRHPVLKALSYIYVALACAFLAGLLTLGRLRRNPWLKMMPTFVLLPDNSTNIRLLMALFRGVRAVEMLMGGLMVICASQRFSGLQRFKTLWI